MKLPLIRQAYQNNSVEKLEASLEVLESLTEARSITDQEMNVIGELITTICGAMEVHQMVAGGMRDTEALSTFAKKVMGSIDL